MTQAHADASMDAGGRTGFDRCNLSQLAMPLVQAHGGTGAIRFCRVAMIRGGDPIRSRPGGEHGLENPGPEPLRIFVFELEVR